jgi:hypothetical protein
MEVMVGLAMEQSPIIWNAKNPLETLIREAYRVVLRDEDPSEFDGSTLSSQYKVLLVNLFMLIKWIFRRCAGLLSGDEEDLIDILFRFMNSPCTDLSVPATSAALPGSITRVRIWEFWGRLSVDLQNPIDYRAMSVSLKSLTVLINRQVDVGVFSDGIIGFGRIVMNCLFSWQIPREFRPKITRYFCAFLKSLARTTVALPVLEISKHIQVLVSRTNLTLELGQYITVLAEYFEYSSILEELRQPTAELVKDVFVHHAESLELGQSLFFIPEPITALKLIVRGDPLSIDDIFDPVLGFVRSILESEDVGQGFFWSTITSAIGLLFVLLRQSPSVDWCDWIQLVLAKLPIRALFEEAGEIYTALFEIIDSLGTFGQDEHVLMIVVHTLGVKDKVFARLQLSRPTRMAMVETGRTLMSRGFRNLHEFGVDAQTLERFYARIELAV